MSTLTEADVEQSALSWLSSLAWQTVYGPDIAPDTPGAERTDFTQVVLEERLRDALFNLNPGLPASALETGLRNLINPDGPTLETQNRAFHHTLTRGVTVPVRGSDGTVTGVPAAVVDFENPANNDWLAVNQFTVKENQSTRRADIVLFLNGLPLGIIELKNPADENTDVWDAWQQLQTYQSELPTLFSLNEFLMVSDGLHARIGPLTAGKEWFKPWKTMDDDAPGTANLPELQTMLEGVCDRGNFLALVRDFIVFDDDGSGKLIKKMAGYHQFHAVHAAVEETFRAAQLQREIAAETNRRHGGDPGDRRIGVVWHNQGSGKSLTMAFYAGALVRHPDMENPTIVVLTDRNDLDDQLFGTFSRCSELLRQDPAQAESRADLRKKLSVNVGGVVFTTIQKFFPEEKGDSHPVLSERRNIVVIADEAHRSQYDFIDGYARHMRDALPNASFLGFTGTPIELEDANTRAVFGDYISVYDIHRSQEDGATVPIYYESRLAKLALDEDQKPKIDPDFEEVTEGEELEEKEALKTKWAQIEAVVGADNRIRQIAEDIVAHYEARLEQLDGKAMVVCMSRRICVELYRELVKLRPDWEDEDDTKGQIKVVMTGSASDPLDWQKHVRSKNARETLGNRFRNPNDPFRVVLVRDMWLTGFDAPSLHTMYVDKPMQGHNLFQAITRVNRVFKDKPGGLVVDYLGLANDLKKAVDNYSKERGKGDRRFRQGGRDRGDAGESTRSAAGCSTGSTGRRGAQRKRRRQADAHPCGPGTHPGPGGGKGTVHPSGDGTDQGVHPVRAGRRGHQHQGRCELLPDRPGSDPEKGAGRKEVSGGPGLGHQADSLKGSGIGRSGRHLRRGRAPEPRHLGPVGRVPVGSEGDDPPERGGGTPPETDPGRTLDEKTPERDPSPFVRGDAGGRHPEVPEPDHRGRAGHRGTD